MKKFWNRCKGQSLLLLVLSMMFVITGCGAEATIDAYTPAQEFEAMIGFVEEAEAVVNGANELAEQQGQGLGVEPGGAWTSEPETDKPETTKPETTKPEASVPATEASQAEQQESTQEAPKESLPAQQETTKPQQETSSEYANADIDPDGSYTTAEDVSLYLYTYGELPDNFMTKKEAKKLGWTGGSLEKYAPGMCIGGDYFGNYEGTLPDGDYHECDIDTLGAKSRGAKRIVYSEDGRIYYTEDHYETFTLLYGEE